MKKPSFLFLALFAVITFVPSCKGPKAPITGVAVAQSDENLIYIARIRVESEEDILRGIHEVKAALRQQGIDTVIEGGLGVYDSRVKKQDVSSALKILRADTSLRRFGLEMAQK